MFALLNARSGRPAGALLISTATAWASLTGPAAAHALSAGRWVVDTDRVYAFNVGTGVADVTATHFHADSHLQSQVSGAVTNIGPAGCEFVRVVWRYADGTTGGNDSARACAGAHHWRQVDLRSDPAKDVYRIDVELRRASGSGRTATTQSVVTRYVGDGVAGRHIDRDNADRWTGGKPDLRANIDYRLRDNCVATLSGRLTWQDTLNAASARLVIVWTYEDGSTQQRASALVRAGKSIYLSKSSSIAEDIRSVTTRIEIYNQDGVGLGVFTRTSHLGDYEGE